MWVNNRLTYKLEGAKEALEFALEKYDTGSYGDKIYVLASLRHSQVLFYTRFPTDGYMESVRFDGMNKGELIVKGFGCFEWGIEDTPPYMHNPSKTGIRVQTKGI